jgi:tetratricopeptide (TPR) repeat protein
MKNYFFTLSLIFPAGLTAQINCNVYKMENNQACYEACRIATEETYGQGTRGSQLKFDEAIALCPTLAYAYFEKAVPYLKRGDFVTYRRLIDKAVELSPLEYLGYRGGARYQFIRDYKGAISDLEKLDSLSDHDIGFSINGDYQLNFVKALCYKAIGQKAKAIAIMEQQLAKENYSPMTYDYLHLGVLKMEIGDLNGGIEFLKKSIAYNAYLAEPYYYLALIYKEKKMMKEFMENMETAKSHYLKGYRRFDPYAHQMDKIYLADIERELKTLD